MQEWSLERYRINKMGHERLGFVPKTRRWQSLVNDLVKFADGKIDVDTLSKQTLANVRSRLENVANDDGVNAAFSYLLSLSFAAKQQDPAAELQKVGIYSSINSNSFQIAKDLSRWIDSRISSREYGELAKGAAIDTVTAWCYKIKGGHDNLFPIAHSDADVWKRAGDGAGFCELSRIFFAKFTEKYISYFLEREASARLTNPIDRDRLRTELHYHVNQLSRHAFESAKITQSFAAGWFNKNTKEGLPSERKIRGFLWLAFDKMREELRHQEDN